MVAEGVTIFFHGHDHVYVCQTLDGVVYQACPRPKDSGYSDGFYDAGHYASGTKFNNSGHLRVAVGPDVVEVAYVRSVLPEHEPLVEDTALVFNGDVCYAYTVGLSGMVPRRDDLNAPCLLRAHPNPFCTSTMVEFFMPSAEDARVTVHGVKGRLLHVLLDDKLCPGLHHIVWDGRTAQGRMPPGMYFCRIASGEYVKTTKVILLK